MVHCTVDYTSVTNEYELVIELVMLAATVVIHCTLIKHRENLICNLVFYLLLIDRAIRR